ncbi:hypothetical protein FOD75_11380 (plasmid) [Limosilactobacillus reuteri]|uniref:Uncharacterized protein n=1 Tax=Limosilactobacillus reuteri TaxID=1598 RepID=A0A517D8L8_LIMRT|nr:hypothetical protein [Limosilactobacillus reuteri]QDR73685.1 hypothetical protein FOD75_11380 [Limosilactobacillus reuteri]
MDKQLEEILIQAKANLVNWNEGENDNDVTGKEFKQMIIEELSDFSIPATPFRILAVAEWTEQCVEDNGIHIITAITQCVDSSVQELNEM